jgi:hypothetical protein
MKLMGQTKKQRVKEKENNCECVSSDEMRLAKVPKSNIERGRREREREREREKDRK